MIFYELTIHWGMLRNAKYGPQGAWLNPCNSGAPFGYLFLVLLAYLVFFLTSRLPLFGFWVSGLPFLPIVLSLPLFFLFLRLWPLPPLKVGATLWVEGPTPRWPKGRLPDGQGTVSRRLPRATCGGAAPRAHRLAAGTATLAELVCRPPA